MDPAPPAPEPEPVMVEPEASKPEPVDPEPVDPEPKAPVDAPVDPSMKPETTAKDSTPATALDGVNSASDSMPVTTPQGPAVEPATDAVSEPAVEPTTDEMSKPATPDAETVDSSPVEDSATDAESSSDSLGAPGSDVDGVANGPEATVDPEAITASGSPEAPPVVVDGDTPSNTEANRICIGESSHVAGVSLPGLLKPTMRMQVHPLRFARRAEAVRMLCYDSAGARLCASARHVIEKDGTMMYMQDFCASRGCSVSMDVPLNFKGPCGQHIEFMPGIRATQHAGTEELSALAVARMECAVRSSNRLLWTIRTL